MPPPSKRRKVKTSAVEEVSFDPEARSEYLTGFHKRKLQRIKHAQEEAAKREKEERLESRRKLRDDRKIEAQRHVEEVNQLLKEARRRDRDSDHSASDSISEGEEWQGVDEPNTTIPVDHEAEYIDEDRFTTVTVEEVDVSKEGLHKVADDSDEDITDGMRSRSAGGDQKDSVEGKADERRTWTKAKPTKPKKKRKKFRYETKVERKITRGKEKAKGRAQAKARRE
ncbi:MAG: hypothetical protein M1817_001813 [Caeruleum heppii]|nr:MAG: hypothetical protein M1817_001813 [Caeruleum heppii]